jgi:Predicted metal-binding, possibly nucleic acid-binding protein
MLKWQFNELAKYKQEALPFSETVDIKEALLRDFGDLVLDVTPLEVKGFAQADQEDIIIHANVTGELTVPSSRSLAPVSLPLDFAIDEVYLQDVAHEERYELEDSVMLVEDGMVDFLQAIVEFTVLQVPLQVLTEEEASAPMPTGSGWAVLTEDEYADQQVEEPVAANTPLAGLKDLFDSEKN